MLSRFLPFLVVFSLAAAQEPEYEMTTYQLVLLHRVPGARPMGEREIQKHQEEQLAYLNRLHDDGAAIVSGPVDGTGDLRWVLVLDVESTEAAEKIAANAPWVRAGRLRAEVHPWWAADGILRNPQNRDRPSRCYLALLERPPGAPEYSEEKLAEIQAGHMKNIRAMADTGELVIAGPMGDDGTLRGIFVFRDGDPGRIRRMVAQDPAVKAGRLGVELYPWHVPEGTLPER